jgi:hypothetical protein
MNEIDLIKEKLCGQFAAAGNTYTLNLGSPRSFNEKLNWLKLYYRDPLLTRCADKFLVREFVKERIGEEYLLGLYNTFNSAEDIDLSGVPEKFVLKTNWGSGQNYICHDKAQVNPDELRLQFADWIRPEANLYLAGYEWCYKNIVPKIVCEEYIGSDPVDYKFLCFNGQPKMLFVCTERDSGLKTTWFDLEWRELPFTRFFPKSQRYIPKPANFPKMIELAGLLAKGFPFVRVDFYNNEGCVKFGELTFYPGCGYEPFDPPAWDFKLGEMLTLPKITFLRKMQWILRSFWGPR